MLAQGGGPVRLDEDGDLVISPLTAEDVPAEAIALKAELTEMLPFAPIVSLLIELDKRTHGLETTDNPRQLNTRSHQSRPQPAPLLQTVAAGHARPHQPPRSRS